MKFLAYKEKGGTDGMHYGEREKRKITFLGVLRRQKQYWKEEEEEE